jgi:hypothetical protein
MPTTELQITETFQAVYNTLDMKDQRKAMRSASRKEANTVKKTAQQNAIASGLGKGTKQDVTKGIFARTYPDRYGAGFLVTVKPHEKKGYHINRQGLEKPVLMWAETGTGVRHVGKRKGSYKKWSSIMGRDTKRYHRSGHSTGAMPRYGFMEKTERECSDGIETRLFGNFQKNIEKAARRNGLL